MRLRAENFLAEKIQCAYIRKCRAFSGAKAKRFRTGERDRLFSSRKQANDRPT